MTMTKASRETPPGGFDITHSEVPGTLVPGDFQSRLIATMARLGLTAQGAADYLGVPVTTIRKWIDGTRTPGAAVIRLLDVLGIVEAIAPSIHAAMLPADCDQTVGIEAAEEIERLRAASAEVQKKLAAAWNDGFSFARKGSGWQSGEDPSTEGLYVARDSKGNVEVGMWYAKTFSGQSAEWSKEFRDLDRDDIVAWMMVPPN